MTTRSLCYITPAVTPLLPDGGVDLASCRSLYRHLTAGGMDGILVLGSIGEFFGLTLEQKKAVIRNARQTLGPETQLIAGVTSLVFDEIVELARFALDEGADAVMVIPPYYFWFPDQGVLHYYDLLAQAIDGDIYLYNFPERTGYDISPAVMAQLAQKHPNIIGVKDTVGGVDHTREVIKQTRAVRPDFIVFSGYDDNFAHTALCGGNGGISGLSNLFPRLFADWVKAVETGDLAETLRCQQLVDSLMDVYAVNSPFIPSIKEGLAQLGVIACPRPTLPMTTLSDEQKVKLRGILERYYPHF